MLLRFRLARRAQTYLKIGACILLGIIYFTFLFRESLNAYAQNKERVNASVTALKPAPQLLKLARLRQKYDKLLYIKRTPTRSGRWQKDNTEFPDTLSTVNPVYEYSEELHAKIEHDLIRRNEHLQEVCERYKLKEAYPPNPWEFFISPGHNLVWCNVFKAASSTWMFYFNILAGYDLKYLYRTEIQPLELARHIFPRPKVNELLESLPTALSFLFVREPFERIVSAYRNKLEGGRNRFYKKLGLYIARHYRRLLSGPWPRYGPTFDEFIRYLVDESKAHHRLDEHWAPIYSFCTPCSVNFSIIGKLETFHRDTDFIIRQAGLESLLLGKLPQKKLKKIVNQSKSDVKKDLLVERYFSNIERSTLDNLLKIYRMDFELFGYDYEKYYDMVQPWSLDNVRVVTPPTMRFASSNTNTTTTTTTTTASSKAVAKVAEISSTAHN